MATCFFRAIDLVHVQTNLHAPLSRDIEESISLHPAFGLSFVRSQLSTKFEKQGGIASIAIISGIYTIKQRVESNLEANANIDHRSFPTRSNYPNAYPGSVV